ncbi:hypothetical protein F5Y19DRAFT_2745 [Xylariaceae sp. FL1651]|nr:hypothetical protein F5Y19DRAFT_2745 [Xylariaceae sp. FL1651]
MALLTFFGLPRELRDLIYHQLFFEPHLRVKIQRINRDLESSKKQKHSPVHPSFNLLLTCHQCYAEGHRVFWAAACLGVGDKEAVTLPFCRPQPIYFPESISDCVKQHARHIRRLSINPWCDSWSYDLRAEAIEQALSQFHQIETCEICMKESMCLEKWRDIEGLGKDEAWYKHFFLHANPRQYLQDIGFKRLDFGESKITYIICIRLTPYLPGRFFPSDSEPAKVCIGSYSPLRIHRY